MLGAAGHEDLSMPHEPAERPGHEGTGMTGRRDIGIIQHGVAMAAQAALAAGLRLGQARDQALAVFDLDPPFTAVNLKARYKVLVKQHHPDAHGGDKAAEEKLKIINQAYATLKASYFG